MKMPPIIVSKETHIKFRRYRDTCSLEYQLKHLVRWNNDETTWFIGIATKTHSSLD